MQIVCPALSSVYSEADITVPPLGFGWKYSLSSVVMSATEVHRKLEELDPSKEAGNDNVPPKVLKLCTALLAAHLAILFNLLLASRMFLSSLKQGFVVPIFKSDDRCSISNYMRILIESAVAKGYDVLVLDQLYIYLRQFISDTQHGFIRSRSTVTNLLVLQKFCHILICQFKPG